MYWALGDSRDVVVLLLQQWNGEGIRISIESRHLTVAIGRKYSKQ